MRDDETYIAMLARAKVPYTVDETDDECVVRVEIANDDQPQTYVRGYNHFYQTHVFVRSDGSLARAEIWE